MTESIPSQFKENAMRQLADEDLRQALTKSKGHFTGGRQKSIDNLPEFEELRDKARDIKNHTIENLDFYLEAYEKKVLSSGCLLYTSDAADE